MLFTHIGDHSQLEDNQETVGKMFPKKTLVLMAVLSVESLHLWSRCEGGG